jgi:hypothetical protein
MLGGDLLLKGQLMWFLPKPLNGNFIKGANLAWPYRSSLFLQVGNVYTIDGLSSIQQKGYHDFPLALSVGGAFEVILRVPMVGVLPAYVSFAWPILSGTCIPEKERGKQGIRYFNGEERIQYFSFGLNFIMS